MFFSLSKEDFLSYFISQINNFFPDKNLIKKSDILDAFNVSIKRIENCFKKLKNPKINKYILKNNRLYFNHLNTSHYSIFLYFLSNTCFNLKKKIIICDKIFYLNKALHSVDLFYEIKLPNIFYLIHPVGTILGRANYSDYLLVYQNCLVGQDARSPKLISTIGKNVTLWPRSSIVGKCLVGKNCEISIGSTVKNFNIASNSIYFGDTLNNHVVKKNI